MCIGVPAKVSHLSQDGMSAIVEARGESQTVSLMMMSQDVAVGDYLIIQVGGFAVEKMSPQQAKKAIALIEALEQGDMESANQLYSE